MRVLVATGGAAHSELAVQQVAEMARTIQMQVVVLTVIKRSEDQSQAEEVLRRAKDLLLPTVPEPVLKTRVGSVAAEIIREGQQNKYDLIVLGQRPSHNIFARIRGVVTRDVVNQTTRSVLIVKGKPRPLKRVLVCDSGAKSPSLCQNLRLHLPDFLETVEEITILHVMSQISAAPGVIDFDLIATADDLIKSQAVEGTWLEQDIDYLKQLNMPTQAKVRHGLVIDEIVAEARAGDYDAVIIGAHRTENMPHFLLDDQARELVGEIDRSTLVVH